MGKKSIYLSYILYTLSFLYSGTVIHSPHYTSGDPVVSFFFTSAVLLAYTFLTGKYFSGRKVVSAAVGRTYFAVFTGVIAVIPAAYLVNEYVGSFGVFAEYYSEPLTNYFALFAVIACAVYGASRGKTGVAGFAGLAAPMFVLWTLAGIFAFITTKEFVLPESPFRLHISSELGVLLKNTVYVCADVTFLAAVIFDGGKEKEAATVRRGLFTGAVMYVILGGVNLLKNLFLFGEEFASEIPNPDLAAIRLIPMFDLPEISIIVNSFACIVKISVYFLLALSAARAAFGENFSTQKYGAAVFALCLAVSFVLRILMNKLALPLDGVRLASLALCAVMCFIFWSFPQKRQNNTR